MSFHHAGEGAVLGQFGEGLASHEEAVAHGAGEALVQGGGLFFDFLARADDEFGGRGRRGSAQVGDEVGDGEIGFVADGGDHGNFGRGDGAGEAFVVEGGEIFGGASAAGDDDDIDIVVLVEVADASGDFDGRGIALDLGGIDQHIHRVMAALRGC